MPQWKKLPVVRTSNTFDRMLSSFDQTLTLLIELERFWSNSNAFDQTLTLLIKECFWSNLNAFDLIWTLLLELEHFQSNSMNWMSAQLAVSSTVWCSTLMSYILGSFYNTMLIRKSALLIWQEFMFCFFTFHHQQVSKLCLLCRKFWTTLSYIPQERPIKNDT